jgi:hypothetical protein
MKKTTLSRLMLLAMLFLIVSSVAPAQGFTLSDDDSTTETEDDDDTTKTEYEDEKEHDIEYHKDENNSVWIETDVMTVTLNPNMPSYQYWYTADANGSLARFMVNFMMIVEFEDSNGDGAYQPEETLAFAPLDAFEWLLQTGTLTNGDGQVEEFYASYTKGGLSSDWEDDWFEDWMPGYDDGDDHENETLSLAAEGDDHDLNLTKFKPMTLRFYGHIYRNDVAGNITDDEGVQGNFTILGGMELKVDIEIGNFPFVSNTSKVAVLNYLREDIASSDDDHYYRLHEDSSDEEIDSEDDVGTGVDFEEHDEDHDGEPDDVQELSIVDSANNITRGFYRWLDKAVITHLNGSETAVDVDASYWTDGKGFLLFLAYPNFDGGSILHDPSMRLVETGSPIAAPTGFLGVPIETISMIGIIAAVVVVAGIAVKRR